MIGDWLNPMKMNAESRKILQQEGLIFDVTELVAEAMQDKGISKAELAARLGKSRSFVTQLLDGTTNMTLKTMADVFTAMDLELTLGCQPVIWVKQDPRTATANKLPAQESSIKILPRKPSPKTSARTRRKPPSKSRKK